MKPTAEQIAGAVDEMAAVIPFFPGDSSGQLVIMREMQKFVSSAHHLRWLVDAAVGVMRKWESLPELRGLYCTRFKPADGREENCSLPGYSPEESEMAYIQEASKRQLLPEPAEITALARAKRLK